MENNTHFCWCAPCFNLKNELYPKHFILRCISPLETTIKENASGVSSNPAFERDHNASQSRPKLTIKHRIRWDIDAMW